MICYKKEGKNDDLVDFFKYVVQCPIANTALDLL